MGKWGTITPELLEKAKPKYQEGDIVVINTGFHHKWADTDEYFGYNDPCYGSERQEADPAVQLR